MRPSARAQRLGMLMLVLLAAAADGSAPAAAQRGEDGPVQLFDAKNVQAAVGAFWVQPGSDERRAGLAHGTATAGTHIASFTGGLAVPLIRSTGARRRPS